MALEIMERDSGGITVLEFSGEVTRGEGSNQLRKKLKEALEAGKTRLVLDVSNLRHIDSSGLGTLVTAYAAAQSGGAKLKLARVTERLNSLLQITKLVTVFEIYPTVEDALKSFS